MSKRQSRTRQPIMIRSIADPEIDLFFDIHGGYQFHLLIRQPDSKTFDAVMLD